MDGLPVEAREGSFSYRASKFVRRNRVTATVAGALAAAVALGAAGTIFEGVRAEQQRQRAEARFNDTRKLADSLLFGFYDSVSKLPGATHAQQLIVTRSLAYLDNLAKDSQGNQGLQLDLADGYVKLASLQGSPYVNNAGLPKEALATADKAIGVASGMAHSLPQDYRAYLTLASAHGAKGEVLLWLGQVPQSIEESRVAIEILDKLVAARPADPATLMEAAVAYETLGDKLGAGGFASNADPATALMKYRRALELMEAAHKLAPGELRPRRAMVVERMKMADSISDIDPEQGLALFNVALTGLDTLTAQEQQESASRRLRGSLLRRMGETEALLGRYAEADRDLAQVQQFTDSILAIDPGDTRAKWDLVVVIHARGDLERTRGRLALAREHYEKVVDLIEKFPGLEQSSQARASLDDALVGLGDILVHQKNPSGRRTTQRGLSDLRALAQTKEASPEILERAATAFLDAQPADLEDARFALDCVNRASAFSRSPTALATKARALARIGDKTGAREAALSGLALLPSPNVGTSARGLRLQLMRLAEVAETR
jgi:tetratricopeptide (TPR) repeat protein